MMIAPSVTISRIPGIKSNAEEIERELLASDSLSPRSSDASILIDYLGSYSCPPLAYAIEIARAMRSEKAYGDVSGLTLLANPA
jgi:hypothetical protein